MIESGQTSAPASVIKTHHNVGGLPKDLKLELIEPLRELYKDEVRALGRSSASLPAVLRRHPFPGPGLAVRIIGEVTPEKLRVCRRRQQIVEQVMHEEKLYDKVWQAFAYLGDDQVTGVLGDERRVGSQVTVKVVESVDAMTADWYRLPHDVLERISSQDHQRGRRGRQRGLRHLLEASGHDRAAVRVIARCPSSSVRRPSWQSSTSTSGAPSTPP